MLTIEPPLYQVRGTTLFRDHAEPDLFYGLPELPQLVVPEDAAGFTLYKYKTDVTDRPTLEPTQAAGGGIAFFDVETTSPSSTALTAEVAALSGRPGARVAPVLFRSASVRSIVAHTEDDRLIEDIAESSLASVSPPHRASFAVALTPAGATLFEAAAQGGLLPVGVAYEMRFLALTPSLHAHVTMNDETAYERFSTSAAFTYYVNAGIDVAVADLVRDGTIKIEIIQFTDDDDQRRQHQLVLDLLKARVQQDFFRPSIPTPPEAGAGGVVRDMVTRLLGQSITSSSALFVLKARFEVVREQKTFELTYNGRTAVELTHVTTSGLSTLHEGEPSVRVLPIDLDDPFFNSLRVDVRLAANFEAMPDLSAVTVNFAKGGVREGAEFLPGGSGAARFKAPMSGPSDDAYTLETEYRFDPMVGTGDAIVRVGPVSSRRRAVAVSPGADMQYSVIEFVSQADWTFVARIELEAVGRSVDGSREFVRHEIALDATEPGAVWRYHRPLNDPAEFSVRWSWLDHDGGRHEGGRDRLTGSSYVVRAGYADSFLVKLVAPLDWNVHLQAHVELHYEDGEHIVDRELTLDAGTPPAPDITIPILDAAHRTYRWRFTLVRRNGVTFTSEWTETDARIVSVHDPAAGTPLTITWIGDAAGVLGLRVDLRVARPGPATEFRTSVFFRPGEADKVVLLPVTAGQPLSYQYEVRRVTEAGEEPVSSASSSSDLLLVRAR